MKICDECLSCSSGGGVCECQKSIYHGTLVDDGQEGCSHFMNAFKAHYEMRRDRPKKWHRVKTMEDTMIPGARFY